MALGGGLFFTLQVEDALGVLPAVTECEGENHQVDREEAGLPNQVASPKKTMLPVNAMGSMGFEVGTRGRSIASPPGQSLMAWAENLGYFNSSMSPGSKISMSSRTDQWSPVANGANDPYTYACGSPTLKNRRKYMSLDQLFSLCKELKIMPDPLSSFFADIFVLLFGKGYLVSWEFPGQKKNLMSPHPQEIAGKKSMVLSTVIVP